MTEGSVPSLTDSLKIAAPESPLPGTIGFRLGVQPDSMSQKTRYFLRDALLHAPHAIPYAVSQELREMFPGRAIIETSDGTFDPLKFGSHGHARVSHRKSPHPLRLAYWQEKGKGLYRVTYDAWLDVEWKGLRFEAVYLGYSDGGRRAVYRALIGDTYADIESFFRDVCVWNREPHDEVLVFEGVAWSKDEDMFRAIKSATLDSLVLRQGLKEEIHADVTGFFAAEETYRRYGVPWKRGILLLGPPGNGKTHTIKAIVNASGKRCLYVKSFLSSHRPDSDDISTMFERARLCAPCVLVLEDLDSLVTNKNRSAFLNEMDGFVDHQGVLTLASTNHPEKLDPALLERPSRFDRTFHLDVPAVAERQTFLALWNSRLQPELQLTESGIEAAAATTQGFSFAYLKELCLSSIMAWMAGQEPGGMDRVMSGESERLRRQMAVVRGKKASKTEE